MRRSKGDRFVEEHYRDHVLQADIGHFTVTYGIGLIAGDVHHDFLNFVRGKGSFPEEASKRVKRRLNRGAHRPLLDVGARDFIALAKSVDKLGRVSFHDAIFPRCVRLEKIVGSGEDVIDAGPARANEHGGGHAARGWFSPEEKGFFHVFRVARPGADSGRLLRSIVEQKTKLRCVQARCTAGGRARSKRSNRAMRTAMRGRLVAGTADAHGHARPDIIAERDGAKKVSPADAELLRSSECSGHNRSAGMRARRAVRVVGLIGMGEDAIGKCSFEGSAHYS